MGYQVLADSPALYEFADENTRLSIFDALILKGISTNYNFESILNIQKQEGLSEKTAYVDGMPVEFLKIGGKYFISQRIKDIFAKHQVDAEYFNARVKIDGQLFGEKYYLFNPLRGIDCIDYDNSVYIKEYDEWDKLYDVSDISKLKILEERITLKEPLFFIDTPEKTRESDLRFLGFIIIISDALAKDLHKAKLRGVDIIKIDEYSYNWKWNKYKKVGRK